MRKYKVLLLVLVCSLAAYGFVVYLTKTVTTVETIVHWDLKSPSSPVDNLHAKEQVAAGPQLASVATDAQGNFYVIGHKKKVLQVVVVDADGKVIKTFPLRRKDGRPIPYAAPYFSVSESGSYLWTLRRPVEDMIGRYKWRIPYWILSVYDAAGTPLQEWKQTNGRMLLQAVGQNGAYVAEEEDQTSLYRVGHDKPERFDKQLGPGDFMDRKGQIWRIYYKTPQRKGGPSGMREYEASVQEIGKAARIAYSFQMPVKDGFKPVFWHQDDAGVYFWRYPIGDNGYGIFNVEIAYRVGSNGIEELFDTSNLLVHKGDLSVQPRKMLKADKEGFVWMEVGYFETKSRLREYQIIKVSPPMPRWRSWIRGR